MATVAETELQQKTSEYIQFVKNFFESSGKLHCSGYGHQFHYQVYWDDDEINLVYKDS